MEMKITTPSFLANAALAVLHLESLISTFVLNFSVAKYHFLNQYHSVWRFGNLEPRNLNYIYICVYLLGAIGCGLVELKITTPSLLANAALILLDLKSFVSTLVNTNYIKIHIAIYHL